MKQNIKLRKKIRTKKWWIKNESSKVLRSTHIQIINYIVGKMNNAKFFKRFPDSVTNVKDFEIVVNNRVGGWCYVVRNTSLYVWEGCVFAVVRNSKHA